MGKRAKRPFMTKFNTFPPVMLNNVGAHDYIDILKESGWNCNYSNEFTREFLGIDSVEDFTTSTYSCSIANALVLRYVLPDFIKSKGFDSERIIHVESDGEYPATFTFIESSPSVMESRLFEGSYFLSNSECRYIISCSENYRDEYIFKVIGKRDYPESLSVAKFTGDMVKYAKEHNFLIGKKIDPLCNFIKMEKKFEWDDLILADNIKRDIRHNILNLIESREIYHKNGLTIKRGIVLSGPPGTGKTSLFKVLCSQIPWTVCWVTPKHLESAKKVSQIISMCRDLAPTVILLEDLDLYASDRSSNGNPALLGELLNQLDGVQENTDIITIATTNNKEVLEKALLDRPGRFDRVIEFPLPREEERAKMLKVFSNNLVNESLPFFKTIVEEYSKKFTGAQVRELVNMAVIYAVDDKSYDSDHKLILKEKYFEQAVSTTNKKDFSRVTGFSPVAVPIQDSPCVADY